MGGFELSKGHDGGIFKPASTQISYSRVSPFFLPSTFEGLLKVCLNAVFSVGPDTDRWLIGFYTN